MTRIDLPTTRSHRGGHYHFDGPGDQVWVRTWYRRDTRWFGHALRSHRARIRVPGLEADVTVEDVGAGPAELGERVDTAYRGKYGHSGSQSRVTASAAATTLRLNPEVAE